MVHVFKFQVGSKEVVVKVFDDTPGWFARKLAHEAEKVLGDSESVVYCPGGFMTEFGLGGEYAVCHDGFMVSRGGNTIVVEEVGYVREKIM